jgi:hypothetical protein
MIIQGALDGDSARCSEWTVRCIFRYGDCLTEVGRQQLAV